MVTHNDKRLPESACIWQGNAAEAVETLLGIEKAQRLAEDVTGTRLACTAVLDVLFDAKDWPGINEHVILLSKRRSQLKQARTLITSASGIMVTCMVLHSSGRVSNVLALLHGVPMASGCVCLIVRARRNMQHSPPLQTGLHERGRVPTLNCPLAGSPGVRAAGDGVHRADAGQVDAGRAHQDPAGVLWRCSSRQ